MSKKLVCFTEHSTSELMMQSRYLQSNSLCCVEIALFCSRRSGRLLKISGTENRNKELKAKKK